LCLSLSTRLFTFNIGEGGEEMWLPGNTLVLSWNEERNEPSMRAEPSRAEPSQSEKLKHSKEIFENITPPFENKSLSSDAYLVCDL